MTIPSSPLIHIKVGNQVLMTRAKSLRSRMRRKSHVRFCRRVGAGDSPLDSIKLYSGVGVQSARATLWMAHLQLPFETVKARMEQRRMMLSCRRGRRINRKVPYSQRAHRQKRFNNRCQKRCHHLSGLTDNWNCE